jgi:acyl transferase domain-containing protein
MALDAIVILLSARTPEQLQQKAADLLAFAEPRLATLDLSALAYTLQVGREAMDERLAFVTHSPEQLTATLRAWLAGGDAAAELYQGQAKRHHDALAVFSTDADLQHTIDAWMAQRKLSKLLDLWVKGLSVDWSKLYGAARPPRISLPVYPFAKDRYWIDTAPAAAVAGPGPRAAGSVVTAPATVLHPLLHANTSDLITQRFESTFTGDEPFLAQHRTTANGGDTGRRFLPMVACL